MVLVACGLNHQTAPISIREKVAISAAEIPFLLKKLVRLPGIHEAALLSTCHRTEIYCDAEDASILVPWLISQKNLDPKLAHHFYTHEGFQGIRHVMRLASGMDSMIPGEPQIFGQLKDAYEEALRAGTIKKNLHHAFQHIFSAGKKVRNQSGIGLGALSVAYAGAELVHDFLDDLSSSPVLMIGSGETASLTLKYLHKKGSREIYIAGRTETHVESLAASFGGKPIETSKIVEYLAKVDAVISATACPLPFITRSMVEQALSHRKNYGEMLFLDLAVPRDIEADVGTLEGIHLYNIDDLETICEEKLNQRQEALREAECLIDAELERYIKKSRSLSAGMRIHLYRKEMTSHLDMERKRATSMLRKGLSQEEVFMEFSERLFNKLVHEPTKGFLSLAEEGREDLYELAHHLFSLSSKEPTSS